MKCEYCKGDIAGCGIRNGRFCCRRCAWTWNNQNRQLQPNVKYDCIVCGKHVEKYVSPSRQGTIDTMQFCSRTCKGKHQSGNRHPRWTGGKEIDKNGHVRVICRDHPNADSKGRVFEHRLVMERKLGRHLNREEVVHHVNDDPSDNRASNLMLFKNNAEHKRFHEQRDGACLRNKKTGQYKKRKRHARH